MLVLSCGLLHGCSRIIFKAQFMNIKLIISPASLHPDPFAMDSLVTTDGDYMASHVTGFPTDDEDVSQQVGGLASMPVTNGVHYHTQQPAMQDLQ